MSDWETFLSWARGMAMNADLDSQERDFKIEVARKLARALTAVRENQEDWFGQLRHELQNTNLLPWQFADALFKQATENSASLRTAVLEFLDREPSPDSLDAFAEQIKEIHPGATLGNLVAFASLILMSRDPQSFPPYRAAPVTTWADRVGVDRDDSRAGGRYFTLLELCDELIERAQSDPSAVLARHVRDRLDAQSVAFAVLKYPPPVQWPPLEQAELMAWRRGEDPGTARVARGEGGSPRMEEGAWEVLGRGLRGEGSAIDARVTAWTKWNARELRRRIESAPDADGGFMERLKAQMMQDPADSTIVLLAELLYIRNAPLTDMKASTKISRVNEVLSWCSIPRQLPPALADALDGAEAFNGGQGYHNQTPAHILWLTRFVEHWVGLPDETRAKALRDPFAFREVTAGTPHDMPTIRYVIEYLAWPGIFPPIVSADHRRRIHAALMPDLGEPSGTDDRSITHDLVALRESQRRMVKGDARPKHWYESPWVERWRGGETPPKAWIVRPGEGGTALVEQWTAEGFVSLSARMLGTVDPGSSQPVVAKAVKEGYTHLDASQREATAAAYHAFLTTMRVDDIVATIDAGRLYVGVVSGEAHYVDTKGSRLRRDVTWNPAATAQDELAAPLPALLDQQGAVVEATAAYDILKELLDVEDAGGHEDEQEPVKPASTVATTPKLPSVSDEVARALHMDREPLQEIVDLLYLRRQLVLYGPPGTGKTYVAKELAKHLVGDPSRVRLVQFHPSYSYEDFFEGFRPRIEEGEVGFKLQAGPLKSLAAEASNEENRGNAYVLIIDEMNRANLAKVFGELYFLLEYRSEAVRLQYQPEEVFYLPPNLFIIGTMNTTDRSIALVDAAIRRRFPFVEMHPTEEPVKSVLGRYLAANHISDERGALLAELNKRMGEKGRDLQIGPSYLMRSEIRTDADIDRVWRYDILPLIEEHYYGQMDRTTVRATFGVEALRRAVAGASDSGDDGLGQVLGGVGVGDEGPGALDGVEGDPLE